MNYRVLRGVLKLRYLVLGGAIGGGVTLNNRFEQWKEGLPDMKWLDEIMPDNDQWNNFSKGINSLRIALADSIHIGE